MNPESLSRRALLIGITTAGATELPQLSAADNANSEPLDWTIIEASSALAKRRISSEELTKLCLARIRKLQPALNAVITLQEESALAQARNCDDQRARSDAVGPLYGIPIALKDNIDTAGVRTTAASRVFLDRVPQEDAEITKRLKSAGAIFLGKLNLDEMAFEGTGTTSCFGPVHNPWNIERITGGSSAGSATAVAAGLCFGSVGTDDGGSVRIPGAFCGVVGFKTTYGRVSTRGIVPSAYSMDTVGPIARSVEDAAALLQVLAGNDPLDAITSDEPVPGYMRALSDPISHLRVGVPRKYFFDGLHPDVASAVEEAIRQIQSKVKDVREVVLSRLEIPENGSYDVELLYFQKPFFDKTPELYHPWSQHHLNELRKVQAVPYVETLKRVRECRRKIRDTFQEVDVLLLPTKREPAPLISETVNGTHVRPPSNTAAFNHFGTPAMTIPCGLSKEGLPIGLQIAGPAYGEPVVLALAYAFQRMTGWHTRRPPIAVA